MSIVKIEKFGSIRVLPFPFRTFEMETRRKAFLPGKEASFSLYGHFGGKLNKYFRERDHYLSSQAKEVH
jgi:hypothetical protein